MAAEVERLHLVIHYWLLIQSFALCFAYDFGYHPSAEEFDNFWRETRTWTRDLLADKRQRDRFVPRYRQDARHDRRPELDFQLFSHKPPQVYDTVEEHVLEPDQPEIIQVQSQVVEVHEPATPTRSPQNATSFPIFFTNPATGIVYALSEVGGSQPRNDSGSGGGISIYITKAQYDADLKALQQYYEEQCSLAVPKPEPSSVLSTPNLKPSLNVTPRPQIIRLEKPKKTTANRPSNKLPPKHTPRPPPVMVTAGPQNAISDQLLQLPTTKRPQQSTTRRTSTTKTKRKKRKKKTPTTVKRRPGYKVANSSTPSGAPQVVIGKRPAAMSKATTGSPPAATQVEKPRMPLSTTPTGNVFSRQPISNSNGYLELTHHVNRRSLEPTAGAKRINSRRRPKSKTRRKKNKPETVPPPSKPNGPHSPLPHAVHLLHRQSNSTKSQSKPKKTQHTRRRGGPDFDLFELMAGEDYDEDDDFYYNDGEENPKEPTYSSTETQSVPHEDSSSAEEGADFGALIEEPLATPLSTPELSTSSNEDTESKNSLGNKRIRRRPIGSASDEDYDSDEDSEGDSGIGGFFRMIFYPVQMAMSRIFDGFAGSTDEDDEVESSKPKYPSYTLYHSAHSNEAITDDEDDSEEDVGGSLGSWFGSWFGFQRRTKKIGSTTAIPISPSPLPTPAPESPGWLESWFGFGKTTAETETEQSSAEDDYDKWFFGWFDSKPRPKGRRRATSTTSSTSTTTTTPTPQVPILTIVDPLRNPQNWIGILAHHIVNSTGSGLTSSSTTTTTTTNPLLQALVTRITTTTPQPDLPRRISYDKYQIWRLKPQDEPQVRALEQFKKGEDGNKLQWLKGPSLRGLTDVLVPPKMLIDFQGTLNFEGIAHEVLIFDVGKAIAYEQTKEDYLYTTPKSLKRPTGKPLPNRPAMTWNKYHDHDDIVKYLETIRMRHPQLIELLHIGRTYEGRPLIIVKIESKQAAATGSGISAAAGQQRVKHKRKAGQANAVFIEAGAQGLAWIGPATATWMISELLRFMKSNKSDEEHEFIRNTTWYIMPVLNPDGYAYSHEYDRFWRKSRSQHTARAPSGLLDSAMTWLQQKRGPNKICYGVDLDRNWLYQWGKRGSSKSPCNEFYAGPTPFSEPETKAVSDFLMDYRTQIKLYISLQAYGQVISYPVKANSTFNSERLDDFLDVAMVGTDGLRKKGSKSRYKVDSANDLIEQRSGCADAFAAYEIGIPFSYTLQLADNGVHGYLLPSSAIESTARDAFEIISGMLDYI